MTYEKSRSSWNSGFKGFKHPTTGKLSAFRWKEINVKYFIWVNGKKIQKSDTFTVALK